MRLWRREGGLDRVARPMRALEQCSSDDAGSLEPVRPSEQRCEQEELRTSPSRYSEVVGEWMTKAGSEKGASRTSKVER
jgi:hypothetical protein